MKQASALCTVLTLPAFLTALVLADPTTRPTPPGAVGTPIALFNGKDLAGWTWVQRPPKPDESAPSVKLSDVWTIQNGILHDQGTPIGYIRTDASYDEYVLTVEQRHINKGNGGILFAITGPDKVWPHCIEAQGLTGDEGDLRGIADFKMTTDAARTEPRRFRKIGPSSESPIGDWETVRIVVDHGHLTVTINGQLQNTAAYAGSLAGRIGLQAEGGEMEFRRIELVPLNAPNPQK